ncbi:MAG: hypothetical protein ACOYL6_06660 [Bacteriovoracaceae bacterium]
MKYVNRALMILLGGILVMNAPVGYFTKLEDLGLPQDCYLLIKALWGTHYLMHLVKAIELVAGLFLIFNRFVPLALMLLLPVMVNIVGINIVYLGGGFKMALPMMLVTLYLVYIKRDSFKPMLQAKA